MRPRLETPRYRLRQRGNGNFYIVWTQDGRERHLSTRTADRSAAQRELNRFLAAIDDPEPPSTPNVARILDGYCTDRKADGVADPKTLKARAENLKPVFGDIRPSEISQGTVRRYANRRKLAGRSRSTIVAELATLRASLHWAVRAKWIERAPEFSMPVQPSPPRDRWLTKAEAKRLIAAAEQTPHVALFTEIALATGARAGAIQELTWDRVDLKAGVIDFGEGRGKKRRGRVAINARLLRRLKAAKKVATTEWVLEYRGERAGDVKKAFGRAAVRAKLPGVGRHTLRHTAATWMVMDGVSLEEVARMLNATKEMIERVYGHHAPDYLRRAAAATRF